MTKLILPPSMMETPTDRFHNWLFEQAYGEAPIFEGISKSERISHAKHHWLFDRWATIKKREWCPRCNGYLDYQARVAAGLDAVTPEAKLIITHDPSTQVAGDAEETSGSTQETQAQEDSQPPAGGNSQEVSPESASSPADTPVASAEKSPDRLKTAAPD